jgi:hypothetical protein
MAVMMSSPMTFKWGLSGLAWFVVPNGFAIMAMIPLAASSDAGCRKDSAVGFSKSHETPPSTFVTKRAGLFRLKLAYRSRRRKSGNPGSC